MQQDYLEAHQIIGENNQLFWEWLCRYCGQLYREKIKPPIYLDA